MEKSEVRRMLVSLAQHIYVIGRNDGERGVHIEDVELDRIADDFLKPEIKGE